MSAKTVSAAQLLFASQLVLANVGASGPPGPHPGLTVGPDQDRWIRWTTTATVVLPASIAGVVSFGHMYELALRVGEDRWAACLIPLSVDGMILASSMTLLLDSRLGNCGGLLPWTLLLIGCLASLAANVAAAEPSLTGRLIAAWPSFALIGAYELLMRQVRQAATSAPAAYERITEPHGSVATGSMQDRAWQWALANRNTDGSLPTGRAIAEHFGRHEGWGRLVKERGARGSTTPSLLGPDHNHGQPGRASA